MVLVKTPIASAVGLLSVILIGYMRKIEYQKLKTTSNVNNARSLLSFRSLSTAFLEFDGCLIFSVLRVRMGPEFLTV